MTNKIIIAGLVAFAFIAGSVMTTSMAYAADKPNGQPFQALWDAIGDLQAEIANIELTPGPQGEQGPPGADGQPAVVQSFHVQGSDPITDPNDGDLIPGLSQTFTTTESGRIYVSSNIQFASLDDLSDEGAIKVVVDGETKQLSPIGNSNAQAEEIPLTVSWSGTIDAGEHTVEIQANPSVLQTGASYCISNVRCHLDVLVFE